MSNIRKSTYPIHPLFLKRWSPRAFNELPITQDSLMTLLEAARWAPSAFNAQPWRFVWAMRGTSAWQPIFDTIFTSNQVWVQRSSALVVICSQKNTLLPGKTESGPNPWRSFDSGAAWASLALQASLSGLAAHGMAGYDSEKLRQAIGLPPDYDIEALVAIGQPGDKSVLPEPLQLREAPNDRRPLEQSTFEGRFIE